MKTVVLRHVAFEDLGVWASTIRQAGHDITYVEAGDDLSLADDADLLFVLGGPIGVNDAAAYPLVTDEIELVRERLDRDAPVVGVCLGAQMMAAAMGAPVYPGARKEIGWGILDLAPAAAGTPLAHLQGAPVLHWHGDTFDLPSEAILLASNSVTPHQAFSFGRSLALQFHAEANGALIERWLIGHMGELRVEGIDVPALRAESVRHSLAAARAGRELLAAYLAKLA